MSKNAKHLKLGILIDDRAVRVVEMELVGHGARMHAAASATAKTADEAGWSEALQSALASLGSQARVAHLAFADRSLIAELVPLPQLKPADKAKVLERHAMKALNLKEGAGGVEYAVRPTRQVTKPEGKLDEHLLVASPNATIDRLVRVCESAGIELVSILPSAEAVYAAFAPSIPKGAESELFVHFENSWTHLVLASDSGWLFTRSLAKTLDPSQLLSENDLLYGANARASLDSETFIIESSLDAGPAGGPGPTAFAAKAPGASAPAPVPPLLLGELRRSILFLERELGVKIRCVAACGPIRAHSGLVEELTAKLERPARLAEEGPCSLTLAGESAPGLLTAYAAAAGATMAGSRKDAMNLLPKALRPPTGISWTRTGAWIGAAASLLACIAFAAVTAIRLPDLEKQVEQFKNLADNAHKNEAAKEDPAVLAARSARQSALSKLRQNRSPISFVVEELSRATPATLALSNVRLFRDESRWYCRIEGKVKEKGSVNELSSMQRFIKALEKSPLFEHVKFVPFEKRRPDPKNPSPDDDVPVFIVQGVLKGVSG